MSLSAAGGWCAPSETIYLEIPVMLEPEVWSPYLRTEDVDWIVRMLAAGEIHVAEERYLDMPTIGIRRGGIRFEPS